MKCKRNICVLLKIFFILFVGDEVHRILGNDINCGLQVLRL